MKLTTLLAALFIAAATPVGAQDAGRVIPDYVIGATDVLQLTVSSPFPQPQYSQKPYTVQNDGTILLPSLSKPVKVAGLTVQGARDAIRDALIEAKFFTNPIVDVLVSEYHSAEVTVQGAVRSPGKLQLKADQMSLSDAIAAAQGFSPQAGARVMVRGGPHRPKPGPDAQIEDGAEVYRRVDITDGKLPDVRVYEDDTITVETAPHFYVNGEVKNSTSEYVWEPGMTLQKAIALAGGPTDKGAMNRVAVKRKDPQTGKYEDVKLPKDKMSAAIMPEDVITVPKKWM
jgi:polysaccharide export outer membrane protein